MRSTPLWQRAVKTVNSAHGYVASTAGRKNRCEPLRAKIRGVESRGILLAASDGGRLRLVTVDGEVASGSAVK